MSDLNKQFQDATMRSRMLRERPDALMLLRLYALFKQASLGDVMGDRPGMGDLTSRAKWDAWHALKGMAREEAMQAYIDLVADLENS